MRDGQTDRQTTRQTETEREKRIGFQLVHLQKNASTGFS